MTVHESGRLLRNTDHGMNDEGYNLIDTGDAWMREVGM